jgi:hypothetical protein
MRLFFLLIAFANSFSSFAQDDYTLLLENEKIIISYQITEVKKKGALLPQLNLSIQNISETNVEVRFDLSLRYEMEIVEGTQVSKICVAIGKTKKGKIKGMFYKPETLTFEQLRSEDFELYLDELKVVSVAKCK